MQYVVIDLEWNNTYAVNTSSFFNEIIEIGAVKLDNNLNVVDTFSCIIKSRIGKKLRNTIKQLTKLTNEDISSGMSFNKSFSMFRSWIGNDETIVLSWGNSDIRVLLENFKVLNGIDYIPFLNYYCDLQKYYQKKCNIGLKQQIGLSTAAERLGINPELYTHHRALGDSLLTADILSEIFDDASFSAEVLLCDKTFYEKLLFKPKVIKNIDSPNIDHGKMEHFCESCGKKCERLLPWKFSNQFFKSTFYCKNCDEKYLVKIRFRKLYDSIDVKKIVTTIEVLETENNQ